MKKLKLNCWRYRHYTDIYIYHTSPDLSKLLSILHCFFDQQLILILELHDEINFTAMGSITQDAKIFHISRNRCIVFCNQDKFMTMLHLIGIHVIEELFIANLNHNEPSENLINFLKYSAAFIVKKGISDIALSIRFPEKEMIISFSKERYSDIFVKNAITGLLKEKM